VSDLVIRPMEREDVPHVCAVDRFCFAIPWSHYAFVAEVECVVGHYRVAELGGEIVGYLGSHIILDEAHITTLGVHPAHRRKGIAERLLAEMLSQAMRSGCRRVTLEVRESNIEAQRLYRKYGFAPVSRRPRYYTDNDEDAVVMWIEDMSRLGFRTLFQERLNSLMVRA